MTTQCGVTALLSYIHGFYAITHNLIICCDDTRYFGTNISNELIDLDKAVKRTIRNLKTQPERSVDAIFASDDTKNGATMRFIRFPDNDQ
jgi:hypothetical protein